MDGSYFIDSLTNERALQKGSLTIVKEVDRVYFDASSAIMLYDGSKSIELKQKGSNSLVVWNPWMEKAKQMEDMPDDGYRTMLCLETGNVGKDARILEANESHIIGLNI